MAKTAARIQHTRSTDAATKRQTTYVPSVDGFRGLAVLSIVLWHCWAALGSLAPMGRAPFRYIFYSGHFGVDVLFLVSGFVLFLPVAVDHGVFGSVAEYARRRWARIVPAFWLAMVLSYFAARSIGPVQGGRGAWISHLFFAHAYAHEVTQGGFGVNGAMWTMSVEVAFYTLLPFIAARFYRHPFVGVGLAITISQLWQLATVRLPELLAWSHISWAGTADAQKRMALAFPSYAAHFAIGMTAAWLYVRAREDRLGRPPQQLWTVTALAATVGLAGIAYLRGFQDSHQIAGPFDHWVKTLDRALLFGVLLLAVALASSGVQFVARNGIARMLGMVSYGTYLSHMPLILLFRHILKIPYGTHETGDVVKMIILVVPLSIAIGIISYEWVEDPIRRWVRKRHETMPAQPVPVRVLAQQW